jgi:integrase
VSEELDKKLQQEKEVEEYRQLLEDSCQFLLSKITKFTSISAAPDHTLYHLELIVDAIYKSVAEELRTIELFSIQKRRFNKAQIEQRLFIKEINPQQTSRLRNLFNQLVLYLTGELKWITKSAISDKLVLPKVLPVVREKQMFNLGLEKHYRNIISFHLKNLKTLSNGQLIGLIGLSTIFDSNRLHLIFLSAIVNSNAEDLLWITDSDVLLKIETEKLGKKSIRLHINTLIFLLEKFHRETTKASKFKTQNTDIRKAVQLLCQDYIKGQPKAISQLELPLQLNKIIEIAGAHYFMHRPAFFHAAMTGDLLQTPLPIETKVRVLTGNAVKRTRPIKKMPDEATSILSAELVDKLIQQEKLDNDEDVNTLVKPLSWQLKSISDLLKRLSGLSKKKAIVYIQILLETPSPSYSLMSLWLIAWLQQLYAGTDNHLVNRKAKQSLKKNSILRYFSTVYRHVLPVFDNIDAADLEEDEWVELLQTCLDRSNDSQLFNSLSRFVRFLTVQFNLTSLPLNELDGGIGFANVNANLITPYEVYEILSQLFASKDDGLGTAHRMQACALILGFFCGLRRKEVLGLRITDIYGHKHRPFLFLRTHKDRSLKNTYSRRRLDLADFIPEPYLKVLMDWHQHQSALNMKYLMSFSEHEIGGDKMVIDPVQEYCRQTTGDETFVFHGLRHSFANLYLIRVLQISKPNLRTWLGEEKRKQLKKTTDLLKLDEFYSLQQSKIFLKKYFPTENPNLPRSTLLQLAELLGHKVPNTTCRSYLHLIDEIEVEFFNRVDENIKESCIDQYWSFDKPYKRTRFKQRMLGEDKRIIETELIKKLYENRLEKTISFPLDSLILQQPSIKVVGELNVTSNDGWPNPLLVQYIYPIYKELFIYGTSEEDIAASFSVKTSDIQRVRSNALTIAAIKTSKGKPRFKHPFLLRRSKTLDKQLNKLMKRVAKKQIKVDEAKKGIDLYLKASQAKNAYRVMLKNAEEFKVYFLLLRLVGLPMNQVGIRIYPSSCFDKKHSELETYWTQQFQGLIKKKIKPVRVKFYSSIVTKAEFGQVEVEPLKQCNDDPEFLEHYQHAIFLFALLISHLDKSLNTYADSDDDLV